jgi:hypothetical protein
MQYPLIDRQLLADLRLVHGIFNTIVMLLFLYQARLGFRIRQARKTGAPQPLPVIKRHRQAGPILAILGGLGFFAGLTLVLLDTGNVLEYPLHFIAGLAILILLIATYKISRDIKGPESMFRNTHFVLGITILCVYVINILFGIGVIL